MQSRLTERRIKQVYVAIYWKNYIDRLRIAEGYWKVERACDFWTKSEGLGGICQGKNAECETEEQKLIWHREEIEWDGLDEGDAC